MDPIAHSAFLGLLQGATEFLPVSSSGHLALAGLLFNIEQGGLTLNLMLHAGTFLATILVLRRRVFEVGTEGFRGVVQPWRFRETEGGRDAWVVLLASIPTAAVGFLLRDSVAAFAQSPTAIGLGFVVTAALIVSTRWVGSCNVSGLSIWGALLLGLAQGMAIWPGISRTGATIAAAMWMGVRSDRAFELSMLISLPAVVGALLWDLPPATAFDNANAVLAGVAVAFGSGVIALLALREIVLRGHFAWFVLWVGPLALATLALSSVWPAPVQTTTAANERPIQPQPLTP